MTKSNVKEDMKPTITINAGSNMVNMADLEAMEKNFKEERSLQNKLNNLIKERNTLSKKIESNIYKTNEIYLALKRLRGGESLIDSQSSDDE